MRKLVIFWLLLGGGALLLLVLAVTRSGAETRGEKRRPTSAPAITATDPETHRQTSQSGAANGGFATTAADYILDGPRRRSELGQALPFRESVFDTQTAEALRSARTGDGVNLEIFPGVNFAVHVTGRWSDANGTRVAAKLDGLPGRDRLFMSWGKDGARGLIEIPSRNLAYEISSAAGGGYVVKEWLFTDVVCATPGADGHSADSGLPKPEAGATAARQPAPIAPGQVPRLNSRPGASGTVFLDFDGEIVTTVAWNSGNMIVAPAARMNATQIEETWRRVVRDFETFDVTVTTIRSVYDETRQDRRTHCVITQNDAAAPGAGGVAYTYSFINDEAYKICWVFIDDHAKYCAEAASHEVGHTFGLLHDGRNETATEGREEYYGGHGSGPTGWAPIMGVGYYQQLSQWSRGEYARANNPENDLAMISKYAPYTPDDHGNSIALASVGTGDRIDGVIEENADMDFYQITLNPGTYSISVQPAEFSNLDTYLDVQRADGSSLGAAFPTGTPSATVSFTLQSSETIYLRVDGAGEGSSMETGYSKYSSLGAYSITGFGSQQQPPSAPVGVSTTRISGTQIRVSWSANPSATSYQIYRNNALVGTVSGTEFLDASVEPSTEYTYTIAASNQHGTSAPSSGSVVTSIGRDEFLMDGVPDFSGYLVSSQGMTIYAAVRGTKLYVATWSPGDKNSGYNNDHFIMVSDSLLDSATTPAPWSKRGKIAIPEGKPLLAGESSTTYAEWQNTIGPKYHFKALLNSGVMEGVIDLVAEFGTMPENIYVAAAAYQTQDGYFYGWEDTFNGVLVSQAPAGDGNLDIETAEFLRIPAARIADAKQNGVYDSLDEARAFAVHKVSWNTQGRPELRWNVVPGKTYQVEQCADLAAGSWQPMLGGGWKADAGQWEMTYTDITGTPGGSQFYRVSTQP